MDASNPFLKEHTTGTIGAAVIAQKKHVAVLISAFLAVLLLLIIILVKTVPSAKHKEFNVTLQKEYENPFSTRTQYVNPFSDYKNPFDNLNDNENVR